MYIPPRKHPQRALSLSIFLSVPLFNVPAWKVNQLSYLRVSIVPSVSLVSSCKVFQTR